MSEYENKPEDGMNPYGNPNPSFENHEEAEPKQPMPQEQAPSEPEMTHEQVQTVEEEVAKIEKTIDRESYPLGEVPQHFLYDPEVNLPINSEKLKAFNLSSSVEDVEMLTQHEIAEIQKLQRSIDAWEKKIEDNKLFMEQNKAQIRHNYTEIAYDEKNRDYWLRRAQAIEIDYNSAQAANHSDNWSWFIKKHGLRNTDGSPLDQNHPCVEELCNGGASNLSGKYKTAGNKYEMDRKDKESQNYRLISENSRYKATNETLQSYIQSTYQRRIEPMQDGVLLLKELGAKLRALSSNDESTFNELREWAEEFLDEYLLENPNTPQHAVTEFRRLASIPLPSENS